MNNKPSAMKKKAPQAPRPKIPAKPRPRVNMGSARSARSPGITTSQAPVSIATRVQSMEPSIARGMKSMRIRHRELILASIPGSVAFTNQFAISLNPGLAAAFPWLAPQAAQWEQYRCHKLVAEYVPIAPTSTQGDVIISPDYDASDPTPTTEVQAANAVDSVEDSCWKRIDVRLDPDAMMGLGPRRFVRQGNAAGDIKTFDVGKLFVSTVNETGPTAIGKLYFDYDFEFFVPQNSPSIVTVPEQTSLYSKAASQTLTTATPVNIAFDAPNFDPLGFGTPVAGLFTPAAGAYEIKYVGSFNDNAAENFNVQLDFRKNGASTTPPLRSTSASLTAAGTESVSVPVVGVVVFNGTDTFGVQVTATGAGGTLISVANQQQLVIALA